MAITRKRLLEYLLGDNIQMTYKSDDTGSGLENIPNFGYVYVYSKLSKASKKRVDELAKTLAGEVKALDENTTPEVYYDNTYYFFKDRLVIMYILGQVKLLKSDRKKLANILIDLRKVLNSDLLERIQNYKE